MWWLLEITVQVVIINHGQMSNISWLRNLESLMYICPNYVLQTSKQVPIPS